MDTVPVSTLSRTAFDATHSLKRIGSGKSIHSAADNPAAAAVAVGLETASSSERAAQRNINDGMSILQTADSASGTASDALQRMRELAVAASSGTVSGDARQALQDEFSQLQQHIDDTAARTEFAGQPLVDGTRGSIDVQAGRDMGDTVRMDMPDLTAGALGIGGLDLSSSGNAQAALNQIDTALADVSSARSDLGATHNRLASATHTGESRIEAQTASESRIMDTDMAKEVSTLANLQLQTKAGVAAAVQSRNIQRTAVLGLL